MHLRELNFNLGKARKHQESQINEDGHKMLAAFLWCLEARAEGVASSWVLSVLGMGDSWHFSPQASASTEHLPPGLRSVLLAEPLCPPTPTPAPIHLLPLLSPLTGSAPLYAAAMLSSHWL